MENGSASTRWSTVSLACPSKCSVQRVPARRMADERSAGDDLPGQLTLHGLDQQVVASADGVLLVGGAEEPQAAPDRWRP
jgi:hypothetical protein